MTKIAAPHAEYTNEVVTLAVRLVVEDGLPYREASWLLWRDHRVFVPFATIQNWVEASGKKKASLIETDVYLNWAFEGFSGYIAVDEVYDGPFCIVTIVDSHTNKRLIFRVLDHSPTSEDILELFHAFHKILTKRNLILNGATTDGTTLYTQPLQSVFPGVRHQACEFHCKQAMVRAVLKDVAAVRRTLKASEIKIRRGRPTTKQAKQIIRKNARVQAKIGELFKHRSVFVKKVLTPKEHQTLMKITRNLPFLRRLRRLVEKMYQLYDRRCRCATASKKLHHLRGRLKRFKHGSEFSKVLQTSFVEHSLRFLEDKQCPSTTNSVERSNRRFRKMQKTIYRVRTQEHIKQRIALDMFRDLYSPTRKNVMNALHDARNDKNQPL